MYVYRVQLESTLIPVLQLCTHHVVSDREQLVPSILEEVQDGCHEVEHLHAGHTCTPTADQLIWTGTSSV